MPGAVTTNYSRDDGIVLFSCVQTSSRQADDVNDSTKTKSDLPSLYETSQQQHNVTFTAEFITALRLAFISGLHPEYTVIRLYITKRYLPFILEICPGINNGETVSLSTAAQVSGCPVGFRQTPDKIPVAIYPYYYYHVTITHFQRYFSLQGVCK